MSNLTKSFTKEFLQSLANEDFDATKYKIIQNEICDTSRWSIHYDMIFQELDTDTYYSTSYSVGATESQDESPYEYDGDIIEVGVVVPVEYTAIRYISVPKP